MPARSLEVQVRERDGVAVADLSGDINSSSDHALSTAYDAAVAAGATTVVLNFGSVEYINSTGIAVIVGLLARARKDGRKLVVCGLSDHYRTIFEITRLIDYMLVFVDEDLAVATAVAG